MSSNSNNQPVELNEITVSSPVVTQGTRNTRDGQTIGFLLGCAKRGRNRSNRGPLTICKVSRIFRDLSESSFTPQLVSIGPIHREDPKLQEYEWLKECYLDDLLQYRCVSTPEETLEACLLKVNTLIPKIRESCAGVKSYSDDEVARMMVLDGCFILEFCFKHENEDCNLPNKMQTLRIAMDLMLLENQVPFVVLQALFNCTMTKDFPVTLSRVLDVSLARYIMMIFISGPSGSMSKETIDHLDLDSTHDHVLGYLHKRFQPVASKSLNPIRVLILKLVAAKLWNPICVLKSKLVAAKLWNPIHAVIKLKRVAAKSLNHIRALISKLIDKKGSKNTHAAFHSIVELDRSGMNFKPYQEGGWSMTIKFQSSLFACLPWFWSKPTLLMPNLVIDDTTELIFRNFIAYEQSFPNNGYYFTSYAYAMDMLIDTQEDIAKLVESGVLVINLPGSNQEAQAADLINKIGKNMVVTEFYYIEEFIQMDKHYNDLWPSTIARLRRVVHFSNRWNFMALIAGIILFTLTVVQTVYTIRAA